MKGSFWRTGLESCALRPLSETETRTASKDLTDGGSSKWANHFKLDKRFEADLYACVPLPRNVMNLNKIPRWTGKSGTPKEVVKVMYCLGGWLYFAKNLGQDLFLAGHNSPFASSTSCLCEQHLESGQDYKSSTNRKSIKLQIKLKIKIIIIYVL